MSTWYYFECLDHTPAIRSEDEFTQHTDDDYFKRAIDLAMHRPVEAPTGEATGTGWFEANARKFLSQHPTCNLAIVDEYERRTALESVGVKALSMETLILEHEISELQMELDGKRARLEGLEEKLTEIHEKKNSGAPAVDIWDGYYNPDTGETELP